MSDYDLRKRADIERLLKMTGGTTFRDLREGFSTRHMDEMRGMGVNFSLAAARKRYRNGIPHLNDYGPEILLEWVTGELHYERKIAEAWAEQATVSAFMHDIRVFAGLVAQGIMIGHALNQPRIALICEMAGVHTRQMAALIFDALTWLYGEADGAAGRFLAAYRRAA